jgi:hypothetical protein
MDPGGGDDRADNAVLGRDGDDDGGGGGRGGGDVVLTVEESFGSFSFFFLFFPLTGFPKTTLMFLIILNTNLPSRCFDASSFSTIPSNHILH